MSENGLPLPASKSIFHILNGREYRFEVIADFDSYLDEIADLANKDEDLIPYWGEVWPSSYAMLEYILCKARQFSGMRMLEIGSGSGFLVTILKAEGFEITASDFQPLALDLIRRNLRNNGLGDDAVISFDIRDPIPDIDFDLIVGADVLYEKRQLDFLVTFARKICKLGKSLLIAEPERSVAKDFLPMLISAGLQVERERLETVIDDKKHTIALYTIS